MQKKPKLTPLSEAWKISPSHSALTIVYADDEGNAKIEAIGSIIEDKVFYECHLQFIFSNVVRIVFIPSAETFNLFEYEQYECSFDSSMYRDRDAYFNSWRTTGRCPDSHVYIEENIPELSGLPSHPKLKNLLIVGDEGAAKISCAGWSVEIDRSNTVLK